VALLVAAIALGIAPHASAQGPLTGGGPGLLPPGGFPGLLPPAPTSRNPQPGPLPGCRRVSSWCVESTLRAMRRLRARLGCDHRAVFLTTYIVVTEETLRSLREEPGFFDDPDWLVYEDVLFANYYFRVASAWAAGQTVPEAWRTAFATADRGDAAGVEEMLLGINAHVQRDEAYVISEVGVRTPDGRTRKPDHDRFNVILERSYQKVISEVRDRYDPTIENTNPSASPADDASGLELVSGWREQVWRNAERLVNAGTAGERRSVETSIEANAATSARTIAANPDPQGHRAFRDAYCRTRLARERDRGRGLLSIQLATRPRRARAGAMRRLGFRATTTSRGPDARRPVSGALIRFAGSRARTGLDGRATLRVRLKRAGRHAARASYPGLRPGRASVRVRGG